MHPIFYPNGGKIQAAYPLFPDDVGEQRLNKAGVAKELHHSPVIEILFHPCSFPLYFYLDRYRKGIDGSFSGDAAGGAAKIPQPFEALRGDRQ